MRFCSLGLGLVHRPRSLWFRVKFCECLRDRAFVQICARDERIRYRDAKSVLDVGPKPADDEQVEARVRTTLIYGDSVPL